MNGQLPGALQAVLYVGTIAIIVLSAVLVVLLLQFRGQIERVVRAVEELKTDVNPLARETRLMVEGFRELSGRVQGQWTEVERIVDTARSWSRRANHLVDEVGSVIEPPVFATSRNFRILRSGLETFMKALSGRNHEEPQQARES